MRLANVVCTLSLAVVLLGCQSSVRDKPVSRSSSQSETTPAVPGPSFKAFIQNVSIYSVPNNRQDLAVSLVVSVVNSGEPTTLRSWMLEVDSQDPSLPSGLEPVHVNGVVDLPGTNGRRVDLGKEDLALKASASSVGTNSKMDGVLTFVLPKTSRTRAGKQQFEPCPALQGCFGKFLPN